MSRAVPTRPGEFGLVERGHEVAEITARLDAAFAGLGGALVVEGPRGIGVSALLHATIEIGRARGAQVACVDPRSDERDVPLALVRRVLGALAVEVPADVARSGRRAISDACERRPMLVVIDDAHAADVRRWLSSPTSRRGCAARARWWLRAGTSRAAGRRPGRPRCRAPAQPSYIPGR